MSFYDKRLEADLLEIRARLRLVAEQVEVSLRHSVQAVLDADPRLANETAIKDRAVNQDIRDIDHLCHLFVARHLPSGSHLRFICCACPLLWSEWATTPSPSAGWRATWSRRCPIPFGTTSG